MREGRFTIAVPDGESGLVHLGEYLDLVAADVRLEIDWKSLESTDSVDLCVVAGECVSNQALAAMASVRSNIPTLLVMDGVLDWRNTWEHYDDLDTMLNAPLLQPILSHKVACMGQRQAEWIADFGNAGRCESVGLPRLDRLLSQHAVPKVLPGNRSLLVASSTTPAYNEHQWNIVERSFLDLQKYLAKRSGVVWRVCSRLQKVLKVTSDLVTPLGDVLNSVDAVISAPSTLIIEAMLARRPVAVLDYFDTPAYVSAAWQIRSSSHLASVIPALFEPRSERLFHQEMELKRQLRIDGPATPRLAALMLRMIEIGREARTKGVPPVFPSHLVEPDKMMFQSASRVADRILDIGVFHERDVGLLQAEVAHLRAELEKHKAKGGLRRKLLRLLHG